MSRRLGIATGACIDCPITDVLPSISRAGALGIEVGTPPRHFDPRQGEQVAALRALTDRLGLSTISMHAPFGGRLDLADPDPVHRDLAVAAILNAAAALKQLGGRIIVVHPSDIPRHSHEVDHRLAACRDSLQRLAVACRQEGLTLALESPLPHLIGGHPDEFAWLLREVDGSTRVCLDTGHLTLGGHWHRFLEVAGGRVTHIHANDNHGSRDDHLPPGEGRIDWREIDATLAAAGFSGWIMLELRCFASNPDEYFRHAFARGAELLLPR